MLESRLIPFTSLQFPLEWKTEPITGSISYGPYQIHLGKIGDEVIEMLNRLMDNGKCQPHRQDLPSEIAKELGFEHLVHSTRPENLIAILRSGELNPSSGKIGRVRGDPFGNDQFVFCSLLKGEEDRENLLTLTGNSLPILVFKPDSILDGFQWHVSAGHPYGAYCHFTTTDRKLFPSAHCSDPQSFRRLLSLTQTSKRNEVVLHQPLSLNQLTRIYVSPGEKEKIVSVLEDEKWNELIIEIDPLVNIDVEIPEHELPKWLTPYSRNSHDRVRLAITQKDLNLDEFVLLMKREYPELIPICDQLSTKGQSLEKFLFDLFQKARDVYGQDSDYHPKALRFLGIKNFI